VILTLAAVSSVVSVLAQQQPSPVRARVVIRAIREIRGMPFVS
jgi:hypothetical protein